MPLRRCDLTLYPAALETIYDEEAALTRMLSGQRLVLLEDHTPYYCVEVRNYPSRPSTEPNVEPQRSRFT